MYTLDRAEDLVIELDALDCGTQWVRVDGGDWDQRPSAPHAFIQDGRVMVSAEEGDGCAEYYGVKGWPYIHPALEAFAEARRMFWEWRDPGTIVLYPI